VFTDDRDRYTAAHYFPKLETAGAARADTFGTGPMKIERIDILPADMPQADPKWRFAIHANRVSQGWLVAIAADDGTVGYGYASATKHMGASREGLKGVLNDFTALLLGRDPFDIEPIMEDLDHRLRGMNQAKAAIDCALHEIAARALGVPLCTLFGGKFRSEFPVLRVLSLKQPEEMAGKARELVEAGYRDIKIKVDGRLDLDAARVRAIRDEVGPEIRLTIDANQAYKPKAAIKLAGKVADLGVEIFEQPCSADDDAGLKFVTEHSPIAVEADESAGSLRDVFRLVSNRIVDLVSLKVPKLGGLRNTIAAARICEAADIPCRLGAHVGPRAADRPGHASRGQPAWPQLRVRVRRIRSAAERHHRRCREPERHDPPAGRDRLRRRPAGGRAEPDCAGRTRRSCGVRVFATRIE
jgi:L-alanine-DL-glutamate epimerase-like enolase superfamily enzyme